MNFLTGVTPEIPIFFSATVSAAVDVVANTSILYDTVMLNEGGMYSPEFGIFTCPVTGIYHFTLSVKADAFASAQGTLVYLWLLGLNATILLDVVSVQLVVDAGGVKTVILSAMANDGYAHVTNQAYVSCVIGNQVYVQVLAAL